uniref:B30.2/SPRY domain-containing protein n=1 Tax=Rhizophagus irregularis (strain DAOM 181602 / DAOM 197198 / MUCL 43194) TaxID=747089 RepID=U9UII7_RHIID
MEIILEYIYTGSIKNESLTKDNIIEAFYAADYFQLPDLQDFIVKNFKNTLEKNNNGNYSPELLSKFAGKMPLTEDNIFSYVRFQYLLSCTYEKEKPFATPEYEVFRYSAILAAKQISYDTYKALMEQLPTLEQIDNLIQVENKLIANHQKVAKELEPLIEYIDFRRIKRGQFDFIEPLKIIPAEIIQHNSELVDSDLNNIRGIPIYRFKESELFWDRLACGPELIIEDNGKVVCAPNDLHDSWRSVMAEMVLENKGIFEWDIIIEKSCTIAAVGVCASENFNYETWAWHQTTGWVLSSQGHSVNSGEWLRGYCPSFGDGTKITVHLDMNKRTCAFTVNGTKYPELSAWNNLASKLYPVVSLKYPGRLRIQPHQKRV